MPAWYLQQQNARSHPRALAVLFSLKAHQHYLQQRCSYPWTWCSCSCFTFTCIHTLETWSLQTNWASLQRPCSHARVILRGCTDDAIASAQGGSQGHQRQLLPGLLLLLTHEGPDFELMLQLPMGEDAYSCLVPLLSGTLDKLRYHRLCSQARLIRVGAAVASGRGCSQGHQVQFLFGCDRLRPQACLGPAGARCASHQPREEEAHVLPHPETHGSGAGPS